jgi:hypothetical protein
MSLTVFSLTHPVQLFLHCLAMRSLLLLAALALCLCCVSASDVSLSVNPPDTPSIYERVAGTPYQVSFDQRAILINGVRELLQSGSIHYTRMPEELWAPLFALARQHGLNMSVET